MDELLPPTTSSDGHGKYDGDGHGVLPIPPQELIPRLNEIEQEHYRWMIAGYIKGLRHLTIDHPHTETIERVLHEIEVLVEEIIARA